MGASENKLMQPRSAQPSSRSHWQTRYDAGADNGQSSRTCHRQRTARRRSQLCCFLSVVGDVADDCMTTVTYGNILDGDVFCSLLDRHRCRASKKSTVATCIGLFSNFFHRVPRSRHSSTWIGQHPSRPGSGCTHWYPAIKAAGHVGGGRPDVNPSRV